MPTLGVELRYGQLFDAGLVHYGEFFATPEYAAELLNGGMTKVNGRPGSLAVVQRFTNAVQLQWRFTQGGVELREAA